MVHGFLSDKSYRKLIHATSFFVNASSGEGLCLPLMEFMACGVPAIAPNRTAMADYVDQASSWKRPHLLNRTPWVTNIVRRYLLRL